MKNVQAIEGINVPRFFYGTAWKEEQTQYLTEQAIHVGFRAIDTANQRRHYFEAGVGAAIATCMKVGIVSREDLFLQTKFTFQAGQDHRLPYDPKAPISQQVEQSFANSLENLGVDKIDSYVLHGPTTRIGLGSDDWEAWLAMETLYKNGLVKLLGISNVSRDQLELLCKDATVHPSFVQNRCFANLGWDRSVRQFCQDNEIVYQGFSLLTANQFLAESAVLTRIAEKHERTIAEVIFRFAVDVGMIPLTGSSNADHLQGDLQIFDFHLDSNEIKQIDHVAEGLTQI